MQLTTINLTLFAATFQQWHNNMHSNNKGDAATIERTNYWIEQTEAIISKLCELLPSGSGFNSGTTFNYEKSTYTKLVFDTEYNHIKNDMYDGWTKHSIIVTPEFGRFSIRITGIDRDGIKEYMYDLFYNLFECTTHEQMIKERKQMFETKTGIYSA